MWTVADVISRNTRPFSHPLPAPEHHTRPKVALMVESMARHVTDEGHQLALALQSAGYKLHGAGYSGITDVRRIVEEDNPEVVVIQDKREWTGRTSGRGFDDSERFKRIDCLRQRTDIFKLLMIKDAHNDHGLNQESAEEVGCHAWVSYYHPKIVAHLSPFIRERHIVRTYHTIDPGVLIWKTKEQRKDVAVLSGAVSAAYPLRTRLRESGRFDVIPHPGYARGVCHTNEYMAKLSEYKVAICTASKYGYALRKIIEASAVGCRVITDLPEDDRLKGIDGNLCRVSNDATPEQVEEFALALARGWKEPTQQLIAGHAIEHYDYRTEGLRLSNAIDALRRNYK